MTPLHLRARPWMAAAFTLVSLAAPPARADTACIDAPSRDCVFAWALATARAEAFETSLRIGAITRVASGLARAGREIRDRRG